jgi:mannose-6-phosphate isomerase
LTEIQQTSDVTYRIYDWDRTDDKGKPRTLHTDLALDAIDFNVYDTYKIPYVEKNNRTVPLINSPHFTTGILHLKNVIAKDYSEIDSFVIYICTEGALQLVWDGGNETMKKGEVILIPAIVKNVTLIPSIESKILEVYIE